MINSGVAVDAGLNPTSDAIFLEPVDDSARPYVNIIVARKEDENNEIYQKIVDTYQTEETAKVIEETSKGSSVPPGKHLVKIKSKLEEANMTTSTLTTHSFKEAIQKRLTEYQALALDIHDHPEVSNYEFYSSDALIKQLEKKDFLSQKMLLVIEQDLMLVTLQENQDQRLLFSRI